MTANMDVDVAADMDVDMAIDLAADMDVDVTTDMDADNPCFYGSISKVAQKFCRSLTKAHQLW
jgi:hypothetical protein